MHICVSVPFVNLGLQHIPIFITLSILLNLFVIDFLCIILDHWTSCNICIYFNCISCVVNIKNLIFTSQKWFKKKTKQDEFIMTRTGA